MYVEKNIITKIAYLVTNVFYTFWLAIVLILFADIDNKYPYLYSKILRQLVSEVGLHMIWPLELPIPIICVQ